PYRTLHQQGCSSSKKTLINVKGFASTAHLTINPGCQSDEIACPLIKQIQMIRNFKDLNLIPPIQKAIDESGYETPTPIQQQAIPPVLAGRDILGCAQTGTGKTAAFALPILQLLTESKSNPHKNIKVLVVTPTRELAIQIEESFADYGKHLPLKHAVIFGGVNQNPQVGRLRNGVDILVATPGRLLDLVQQKIISLKDIEIFVLDEADRMLDMGFIHDIKKLLKILPPKRQNLFFSA